MRPGQKINNRELGAKEKEFYFFERAAAPFRDSGASHPSPTSGGETSQLPFIFCSRSPPNPSPTQGSTYLEKALKPAILSGAFYSPLSLSSTVPCCLSLPFCPPPVFSPPTPRSLFLRHPKLASAPHRVWTLDKRRIRDVHLALEASSQARGFFP